MDLDLPTGYLSRLSDEVLLIIFRNLSTKDLLSIFWCVDALLQVKYVICGASMSESLIMQLAYVCRTSRRLQRVCYETDLWTKIEEPPDNLEILDLVINKFASPKTTVVKLVSPVSPLGNKGYRCSLCPSLIETLHYRTLSPKTDLSSITQLHLIRQKFNGTAFRLQMLPKTLKILSLAETHIENVAEESYYFQGLSDHFTSLEELDLSYCSWVSGHSLMSLSKFPSLTKLLLRGCRKVGECLAYVSLASRFGFKTLKVN